jgi:hypothetical protein
VIEPEVIVGLPGESVQAEGRATCVSARRTPCHRPVGPIRAAGELGQPE